MFLTAAEVCTDTRQDVVYVTEEGYAEFTSRVPLHSFTGSSDYLHGLIDFDENLVDFYLDLSTIKSGIGRRDRDIYRTLNVEEFPFAEFTGSFSRSFDQNRSEAQQVEVRGEFTIHGVTREVTIEGTLQKQGEDLYLEAEWILNLEDYDITPPGILFYRVNEEQELLIEVTLSPKARDEL
jgi:polyisoprenoid-binding protein YceI